MPGVSFHHSFFDASQHLIVAELHPRLADQIAWRHFAGETFDDDVGVELLGEVYHKIDVFLQIKKMKGRRILQVFFRHFRAFKDLQLVELHCCQG